MVAAYAEFRSSNTRVSSFLKILVQSSAMLACNIHSSNIERLDCSITIFSSSCKKEDVAFN